MSFTSTAWFFRVTLSAVLATGLLFNVGVSVAQSDGRPEPAKPESQAQPVLAQGTARQPGQTPGTGAEANPQAPPTVPAATSPGNGAQDGRKPVPPGKVTLAFFEVPVDEKIVAFIAESTGKIVIPINLTQLKVKKVTLMNQEPIERAAALDLLLAALRHNGVGISETKEVIVLDLIENMPKKPVPVFTARDDIMNNTERGNFVVKIFRLTEASVETVGEKLEETKPDSAVLTIDPNSNQIIFAGTVAEAQHLQKLINELDHNYVTVKTVTWRLRYADATAVSEQVMDLFENSAAAGQQGQRPQQRNQPGRPNPPRPPGQGGGPQAGVSAGTPGPVVELRVSVNVQQNSVTVQAEPVKIEAIDELIQHQWDLPRPKETFKVYELHHTDPIKMRDLIQALMGQGGGAARSGARPAAGRTGQPGAGQGGGAGGGGLSEVLGDIYRVEAYPDRNSIIVISKTTDALDYLDAFIEANDQPSLAGLPQVVELRHANAVSLADEINVLLAEAGTSIALDRPASGLSAEGPGGFETSGSSTGGGTGTGTGTGGTTGGGAARGTIEFPWQRGRQRDDQSDPSPLIGKIRIVPIVRQNALAVLAPIAQRYSIIELIKDFDRPGRQVMITAIIAEVQLADDMAFGVRLSSSAISATNADNAISGTLGFEGTKEDIFSKLFDTSVLDVNADINVLIQALAQKTNVRIIQQPRVFTADNQEAAFFQGQQIPFITNSVVNSQVAGGVTQSFEYKKVGVLLNVRPHITVERDVDMEIRLSLSAVVPGQTLFGGAILDLRETTTKLIVKNGQTIMLSGLLRDLDSKVTRGLPLLSEIPLIGELFKSRENSKTTHEMIAFITPIVVDNPSENDENFNRSERQHLRDLSKPVSEQKKESEKIRDRILAPMRARPTPPPAQGAQGDAEEAGQAVPAAPDGAKPSTDAPGPADVDDLNKKSPPK